MAAEELGPWAPFEVDEVVALFGGAPIRWWISGARALDLHLGRSWRKHEDVDVGVSRPDVGEVRSILVGWDVHVASGGRLRPWHGEALQFDRKENNLWCRRADGEPWLIDVTIGEGDEDEWIYKRDWRFRLPWSEVVLETADGVPYLAPELQLLFKSKGLRDKDDIDAEVVIPELTATQRTLLAARLPVEHPWQSRIARAG